MGEREEEKVVGWWGGGRDGSRRLLVPTRLPDKNKARAKVLGTNFDLNPSPPPSFLSPLSNKCQ